MRLLFIHEVNWLRKVTFEIHELPELLSAKGHEVDFIDFPEGETRSGLSRFIDIRTRVTTVRSRTVPGSAIRLCTPGRVFPPPLDRLVATITFVPLLIRLLRRKRYDAIVLYGVPTNGWQTVMIARLFKIPVLYRGIDVAHALRRTRFARLIEISERFIYRNATQLSVNNVALRDYCVSRGAIAERVSVDYPGLDIEHFRQPTGVAKLRESMGIQPGEHVVIYMGTFFRFSGLDRVLNGFGKRGSKSPAVKLVLVGGGEQRIDLENLVDELDLTENVVFTGFVDYADLPRYLATADVAISPFQPQLVSHKALPWKVVQYVASGVPVVSTKLEGLMGLCPEGQGVLYVNDLESIWETVDLLLSDKDKSRAVVESGLVVVKKNCNWTEQILKFERVVENVASSAGQYR